MNTDQQPGLLHVERRAITHPDAQLLVEAVQEEYVARYGSCDESPIDPRDFEDPLGRFFVGYLDGVPVATGAWRRSGVRALGVEVTAEVKRMYVVPAAQRRGLARQMLAHLEASAAEAGIELKLQVIERLRRMATQPANQLLQTALSKFPADGSPRVKKGLERALKGFSVVEGEE